MYYLRRSGIQSDGDSNNMLTLTPLNPDNHMTRLSGVGGRQEGGVTINGK